LRVGLPGEGNHTDEEKRVTQSLNENRARKVTDSGFGSSCD
jgi:hypothetical protein